tara:strand:+ start:70 stop:987 length:918 start_codon:yes stop_codon:yes gene_type:complete
MEKIEKFNNIGVFFYSPYPDWVIERTYKSACIRLNQDKDIFCQVIVNIEDLNNKINNDFYNFDKVLLVSHKSFNCDEVNQFGDNVYFYGVTTLNKNIILGFLESNGIPVTPYIYQPKDKEEIFEKLGNEVVLKPNECYSYKGHLVKEITYDNCPDNLDRWIFSKYCATSKPPFVHRRVTCLFGEPIFYFENHNKHREYHFYNPQGSSLIPTVGDDEEPVVQVKKMRDKKTIEFSKKISTLLSNYFGCGVVGCDFVIDDEDNIFLCEANTNVVAIHSAKKLEEIDNQIDCGESIYTACIKKLGELR